MLRLLTYPGSLRIALVRRLLRDRSWISLDRLLAIGALTRPGYTYCILHAARLARRLGIERISALEFGVAGGNGLVACEAIAERVSRETGIGIEIYGFDTGAGLPPPRGPRDLPYWFREEQYRMDPDALQDRLQRARLVLGDVEETIDDFFRTQDPAPVGAVFQDLDYESSTRAALRLFEAPSDRLLPRAFLFLDDVIGSAWEMYGPYHGELAAVESFNRDHDRRKIYRNENLVAGSLLPMPWHHQIFYFHDMDHPLYDTYIGGEDQERIERGLRLR